MKYAIDLAFRGESLEEIRSRVDAFMGVVSEERYSDFRGGIYFIIETLGEVVKIQRNQDGDELAEDQFPDYDVLVLFDPTTRVMEIEKTFLASRDCIMIRKREYPRQ